MYMEHKLDAWENGALGPPRWGNADFTRHIQSSNGACQTIHQARPCTTDPRHWRPLQDLNELKRYY